MPLCHATNSNTNPYVSISPNVNYSGIQGGYENDTGPIWNSSLKALGIKWGDIIPPINDPSIPGSLFFPNIEPFTFPGLNWTAYGQAWWHNGCKQPGYPPPPIGTSCSFAKTMSVPSSVTISVTCRFLPGSPIKITLNGAAYSTATAPPSGTFIETITTTNPHSIALNGGPKVSIPLLAINTFVASGVNPLGATNVATTMVIVS